MNVLSLFDGISAGMIALERAGFKVDNYYAAEIDPHAIKISQHNYPNIVHIGDVTKVRYADGVLYTENGDFNVGKIDLVIGGSPCQSISNLGDGSGLSGKSGLFFHWLRIRDEVSPSAWLLENVQGNKKAVDEITSLIGGKLHRINSNLLTAQNRARLYWTNIDVAPISCVNVSLQDILESEPSVDETKLKEGRYKWLMEGKGQDCLKSRYAALDPVKANCLTARSDASWNCNYVTGKDGVVRKLSCIEYERLQTVPENYTLVPGVHTRERYKSLGNGWTVDVIAHIFKGLKAGESFAEEMAEAA